MTIHIVYAAARSPEPVPVPVPAPPASPLAEAAADAVAWAGDRPLLAPVAVGVAVVAIVALQVVGSLVWRWRHRRLVEHAHHVTITPPPEVDPAGAGAWWANLAALLTPSPRRRLLYGIPHVAVEYRWTGRALTISIWVPGPVPAGPVAAAARAAWPGTTATITPAGTTKTAASNSAAGPDSPHRAGAGAAGGPVAELMSEPLQGPAGPAGLSGPRGLTGLSGPLLAGGLAEGGALVPALPGWYPLETDHDSDPMRALVAACADLHGTEQACVQILARPATPRQVARLRQSAAGLRTGRPPTSGWTDPTVWLRGLLGVITEVTTGMFTPARATPRRNSSTGARGTDLGPVAGRDPLRERDVRPAIEKAVGTQWEVAVRYAVTNTSPQGRALASTGYQTKGRAMQGSPVGAGRGGGVEPEGLRRRLTVVAHAMASAFGAYTARNRLRRIRLASPVAVLAARPLRRGFLLSAGELASLAGLPLDLSVPGLDRARAKAVPAPVAVPAGGRGTRVLGRAEVGGHAVALPVIDARQHLHVLGSTGSGKSTFMTHLILDDIRNHRGVVVIDPKGDLVLDVLDRLPLSITERRNRLVVIDPDQPGGATFNPLQVTPGTDADLVVDNVVAIFSRIFQRHWGPRIDDVLRVACLTLMRHMTADLTKVPPLLNDKQFRAKFTVDLDDPEGLRGFWEWFETTPASLRAQVIGPVLARLRAFLLRDFVRDTLSSPTSSFDMRRVLDGGILLARVPKGQLGEDTSKLLGSFLFSSVWQAATARARIPEHARRDASIYIDEAHNVLNLAGSVQDMLAEARGYHLSLVLAHQNLTQLPRETQLALSANARSKIFFACSPEDAHQLARHTLPELDEHDLNHLDAYTAATRLLIGSRETAAFTLRTNPPTPPLGHTNQIRTAIRRHTPANTTDTDAGAGSEPQDDSRTDSTPGSTLGSTAELAAGPAPAEGRRRTAKPGTPTRTGQGGGMGQPAGKGPGRPAGA
jgi:hypothetical protein